MRRHRLAAGLSQEALAERARISVQAVGALERGDRRTPQRDTLALLTDALALDAQQRRVFESAAVRPSGPRSEKTHVTAGPWPTVPVAMLPLPLSSYVGNDAQIREIADLVREQRLVTLTGPGGIGKTRMALEVGTTLLATPERRVRLVELAPLGNPALVTVAIATALGLQEVRSHALLETLQAYLQLEATIVLLDNCEHVITEAAYVVEKLLRACPTLRILATSREPLRVPGERIYRMLPLTAPAADAAREIDAAGALAYGAVELFVERARAADRLFAITDATAPAIASVCAQLDGIPLAIELAAARVSTIPVTMIAERLAHRFSLLSRGERTAHARHRTMWDAIEWSYDMLAEPERLLFERLSIFAGGCTLEAARTVCAGDELTEPEIGDILDSLVEKSLVTADVSGRQTRFGMLESFREFAREKLAVRGSSTGLARAHARGCLAQFERLLEAFETEPEDDVFAAVRADLENVRTAIEWAFGSPGDVILGQRLFLSAQLWLLPTEVRAWVRVARAHVDAETSSDIVVRLASAEAGLDARTSGTNAAAAEDAARAVAFFDELGDDVAAAQASFRGGCSLLRLDRIADAEPVLYAALERARSAGALRTAAQALMHIGRLRVMQGELNAARALCDEALALFEGLRSLIGRSVSLQILGEIALRDGDVDLALDYGFKALQCSRERNEPLDLGVCLNNVAACLITLDRFDEAYGYAREALDLAVRYAMKPRMLWALHHLAAIEALRPRTIEHARAVVRAARVMGYVDARIAEIELKYDFTDRQENERVRLALDVLDSAERESALAAGAAMTQDEAIEEALGTATADASAPAPALGGDVDFERSGTTGRIRDL